MIKNAESECERLRVSELWLARINDMMADGISEDMISETMMAMALALSISRDGARETAINLSKTAFRLGEIASRNESASTITRAQLLKAGLRLN